MRVQRSLCHTRLCGEEVGKGRGCGGGGNDAFPYTAHVSSGEHTLQRPQHDHDEQQDERHEEHQPLPVRQAAQQALAAGRSLDRGAVRLGGPNVNADAEGRGALGGPHAGAVPRALVAQLPPLQPHRLLLLLVVGKLAQDLAAGGQGWGPLLWECGGVATEGTGEVFAVAVAVSVAVVLGLRHGHEAGEALQAEGVGALQQLGRLEDVVVRVVADGALRLGRDRHPLLELPARVLGVDRHMPDLWSLVHFQQPSLSSVSSPVDNAVWMKTIK